MNDKSATKTPLLVKKSEAKKGSLWHDFAHKRIIKQHGGLDIPEDDLHAVTKYVSPVPDPTETPEETDQVLSEIELQIKTLQEKEQQQQQNSKPSKPPEDFEEFLDKDTPQKKDDYEDELD